VTEDTVSHGGTVARRRTEKMVRETGVGNQTPDQSVVAWMTNDRSIGRRRRRT